MRPFHEGDSSTLVVEKEADEYFCQRRDKGWENISPKNGRNGNLCV